MCCIGIGGPWARLAHKPLAVYVVACQSIKRQIMSHGARGSHGRHPEMSAESSLSQPQLRLTQLGLKVKVSLTLSLLVLRELKLSVVLGG